MKISTKQSSDLIALVTCMKPELHLHSVFISSFHNIHVFETTTFKLTQVKL